MRSPSPGDVRPDGQEQIDAGKEQHQSEASGDLRLVVVKIRVEAKYRGSSPWLVAPAVLKQIG
jgi:hypothetical protein